MSDNLEGKVTYSEERIFSLVKTIRRRGYSLATHSDVVGWKISAEPSVFRDTNYMGIFKMGFLCINTYLVGELSFDLHQCGTWNLSVFGRKHVPELTELATELSQLYGSAIEVKLATECRKKIIDSKYVELVE